MGQAFDASRNDDSSHMPPEVFDNPDFKRSLKMFLSPGGHPVRFIISHESDPAGPEGISDVETIRNAAAEGRPRGRRWRGPRSTWPAPRPSTWTWPRVPHGT
jgi:uncharacterized membrane protein YdfJ with MMPL/SSD domain